MRDVGFNIFILSIPRNEIKKVKKKQETVKVKVIK